MGKKAMCFLLLIEIKNLFVVGFYKLRYEFHAFTVPAHYRVRDWWPTDIRSVLQTMLPYSFPISAKHRPTRPLPLSLLAYRTTCLAAQLNVCAFTDPSLLDTVNWQNNPILFSNSTRLTSLLKPLTKLQGHWDPTVCKNEKHQKQFCRHLTPKKRHEIDKHSSVSAY